MRLAILTFVPALLVAALTSQENVLPPGSLSFPVGVLTDSQGLVYTTSKGDGASVGGELAVYNPTTNTQSAIAANRFTTCSISLAISLIQITEVQMHRHRKTNALFEDFEEKHFEWCHSSYPQITKAEKFVTCEVFGAPTCSYRIINRIIARSL